MALQQFVELAPSGPCIREISLHTAVIGGACGYTRQYASDCVFGLLERSLEEYGQFSKRRQSEVLVLLHGVHNTPCIHTHSLSPCAVCSQAPPRPGLCLMPPPVVCC